MDYLLKTEPSTYSFADLEREKTTIWDGVSNPVALKNLARMKAGERLVIYIPEMRRARWEQRQWFPLTPRRNATPR